MKIESWLDDEWRLYRNNWRRLGTNGKWAKVHHFQVGRIVVQFIVKGW